MIFQKVIGPRKSACSYRKLLEKPDILRPYLILSIFHVPDMMAHAPLYGVRLYARERGNDCDGDGGDDDSDDIDCYHRLASAL